MSNIVPDKVLLLNQTVVGKQNIIKYDLISTFKHYRNNEIMENKRYRIAVLITLCAMTCLLIIFWFLIPYCLCKTPQDYPDRVTYNTNELWTNTSLNIILVGDSLIDNPCVNFDLLGKLHNSLTKANYPDIRFKCIASGGYTIHKINQMFLPIILKYNPHGVIMFGHSDASDYFEMIRSQDEVNELRSNYQSNLTYFITSIMNKSSAHIIGIGGPEILGEGAFGLPLQWWSKDKMMNDYRDMKRNIAQRYKVNYIDIREAFLHAVKMHNPLMYCGYLTYDGEHENDRGTSLLAERFVNAIDSWIKVIKN